MERWKGGRIEGEWVEGGKYRKMESEKAQDWKGGRMERWNGVNVENRKVNGLKDERIAC